MQAKRPQDKAAVDLDLSSGSNSFYRFVGDATGPLDADHDLLYRAIAAAETGGNFRDNVHSNKLFFAPSIEFAPSEDTSLRGEASFLVRHYTFDAGLPLVPQSFLLPQTRTFFPPNSTETEEKYGTASYEFTHKFDSTWQFRSAGAYSKYNVYIGTSRLNFFLESDGQTLDRQSTPGPQSTNRYTSQNEVVATLHPGTREVVLLAGGEVFWYDYPYKALIANLPSVNIFNPVNPPTPITGFQPYFAGEFAVRGKGAYTQAFSQITDKLAVLAGVRYDWQRTVTYDSQPDVRANHASPRIGFTYRALADTILYANWASAFTPNLGEAKNGSTFPPDTVTQSEIGIKQDFLDKRLRVTLAGFHIIQSNVLVPDITQVNTYIPGGKQRSNGLEVDLTGRLSETVDVLANYGYTIAKVISAADPNSPMNGEPLPGVPKHNISGWIKYHPLTVSGLKFGLGTVYNTPIEASLPNTVLIPSGFRLDASVGYERDRWRGTLNLQNALNRKLYSTDEYNLYWQPTRTVVFTLGCVF